MRELRGRAEKERERESRRPSESRPELLTALSSYLLHTFTPPQLRTQATIMLSAQYDSDNKSEQQVTSIQMRANSCIDESLESTRRMIAFCEEVVFKQTEK